MAVYTVFKSYNAKNPNGGIRGCWGWKGFCDVHGRSSMREAVASAAMAAKTLEHVNTFVHPDDSKRFRSVYLDNNGTYWAVEINKETKELVA